MSRKPSQASHAELGTGEELNLSPIMALLVILIPMLLAMFNFFEVKVQAVAAPKLWPAAARGDTGDKPLNLTVQVSERGFTVKMQDELQTAARPIPKATFEVDAVEGGAPVTRQVESYDYAALYSHLRAVKQRFPKETTINVAAEMDIPWHVVARTIDAARVELDEARFEGRDRMRRYMAASPRMRAAEQDTDGDGALTDADREQVTMFPRVVFVVAEN